MDPGWATENYGFPADPAPHQRYVCTDGSHWEFALTGIDIWEISRYSEECASPGCESILTGADMVASYCPSCLKHGHHLGVHV
jgi:hypothetical protein